MNWQTVALDSSKDLTPVNTGVLQRKCACGQHAGGGQCEECRKKTQSLQRRKGSGSEPSSVPPIVHEVLRSTGQPLDPAARSFMEPRFNQDFSRVRVHIDTRAAESAKAVNALAYTVGRHIVFGRDQFMPQTKLGRQVIAHELTHVVQQDAAEEVADGLTMAPATDGHEREAETRSQLVGGSSLSSGSIIGRERPALRRKCVDGQWKFEYDGCSAEFLKYFMVNKDNPAGGEDTEFSKYTRSRPCDKHDRCYQTCDPDGREACDLKMFWDMLMVCREFTKDKASRHHCENWARDYYAALRIFGGSAFQDRQREVCGCLYPASGPSLPSVTTYGQGRL